MKNNRLSGAELCLNRATDDSLAQLHVPVIPLTVPTFGETILINSFKDADNDGLGKIVIETEEPGRQFTVSRLDDRPLQVKDLDPRSVAFDDVLFNNPVPSLTIRSSDAQNWQTNVEKDNMRHEAMFCDFIDVLSNYALTKQLKIKYPRAAEQSAERPLVGAEASYGPIYLHHR